MCSYFRDPVVSIGSREVEVAPTKDGVFLKFGEFYIAFYLTPGGAREVAAALLDAADHVDGGRATT